MLNGNAICKHGYRQFIGDADSITAQEITWEANRPFLPDRWEFDSERFLESVYGTENDSCNDVNESLVLSN